MTTRTLNYSTVPGGIGLIFEIEPVPESVNDAIRAAILSAAFVPDMIPRPQPEPSIPDVPPACSFEPKGTRIVMEGGPK
ncbi:MAG: hypothetical protein Q4F91_07820 [Sutterella sp.]|nr:hypothetical protein [Sutterella sp.]